MSTKNSQFLEEEVKKQIFQEKNYLFQNLIFAIGLRL